MENNRNFIDPKSDRNYSLKSKSNIEISNTLHSFKFESGEGILYVPIKHDKYFYNAFNRLRSKSLHDFSTFNKNKNRDLFKRNICVDNSIFNSQSNMETFYANRNEISSFSQKQSPIQYITRIPFNSEQHHINVVSKDNCNNCEIGRKLIQQNENAQSEIRKLKLYNDSLKKQHELEINKYKLEIEHLVNQINSELEKLNWKNENLKSQLYTREREIDKLKSDKYKLEEIVKNLTNENTELKFELSDKFDIENIKEKSERKRVDQSNHSEPLTNQSSLINDGEQNLESFDTNTNNLLKPIGFANPKGYCFLNCVVQQFYSCTEFRKKLIEYHITSKITDSTANNEKKIFVNNFCKLMDEINKRNFEKVEECVSNIQDFFQESSFGDDVLKCFTKILSVLLDVSNSKSTLNDLFYGQIANRIICSHCNLQSDEKYQFFNSIALPVPKSEQNIPLEEVIEKYLEKCPLETNDNKNCNCSDGSRNHLYSITKYLHMPFYLFIYLNRGSYFENGEKINTFITCNNSLSFPGELLINYQLISIIDHIGDNLGGHYLVKSCFETNQWWLLNDSYITLIEDNEDIVTKQAIVFLFKKFTE